MALSIIEAYDSGDGEAGKDSTDVYRAFVYGPPEDGADDPATVLLYAAQHFSLISTLGNVLSTLDRHRLAPCFWLVTGNYKSPPDNKQTNDASFSFTTGGGSEHITHSRKTTPTVSTGADAPASAPDFKGGIGVSDNRIEGVDIHTSTFDFKLTFYLPVSAVTDSYVDQLFNLKSCVNSDNVTINIDGVQAQFDPGELLYLSADGQKRKGYSDWELTLNFSAKPNAQNLQIGPDISVPAKKGWEYLWVLYQKSEDTDASVTVQIPIAAYVEQVYDEQPLSPLIQPTSFGQSNTQPWLAPALTAGGGLT